MNYLTNNISNLSRSAVKDLLTYQFVGIHNNHKGLEESRDTGYGVTHLIKQNQDRQKITAIWNLALSH